MRRQFTLALALFGVCVAGLALAQQSGAKKEVTPAPTPAPASPEVDDLMKEMEKAAAKIKREEAAKRPRKPPVPEPSWRSAPRTPYPPEAIEWVAPGLIRIWGHLVELHQEPPSDPPDPYDSRRRDSYYVIDPTPKHESHFPNPPSAREVRDVLDKLRPVTKDRIDYFAPIDQDENVRDAHCFRLGWWLYVNKVELEPHRWTAEVSTSVKLSGPFYVRR